MDIEGIGSEELYIIGSGLTFVILCIITIIVMSWTSIDSGPLEDVPVPSSSSHSIDSSSSPSRRIARARDCPICLEKVIEFPCETSCRHIFCTECLLKYRQHNFRVGPMSCPYCRQEIRYMYENHSRVLVRAATTTVDERRMIQLAQDIVNYNARFSEPRSTWQQLCDTPLLLRWLVLEIRSNRGLVSTLNPGLILFFLFLSMYVLSPIDAIPELSFGLLGYLDDVLLVLFFMVYFTSIFRQRLSQIQR